MANAIESLFVILPVAFQADKAKGVDTVIQMNAAGAKAGQWNALIKDGMLSLAKGMHSAPEYTLFADTESALQGAFRINKGEQNETILG